MINIENENMNQLENRKINGLGLRLRQAREAMSLTNKDAAAHLHLSVNIINIIENEQFADGPPPTFMRGYLRSYARFLHVPDHEISKTLQELDIPTPVKSQPVPILHTRAAEKTNRYIQWVTYLIIITLVALVGLWWNSHQRYIISDVPTKNIPVNNASSAPVEQPKVDTTVTTPAPAADMAQPTAASTESNSTIAPISAPAPVNSTESTGTTVISNTATSTASAVTPVNNQPAPTVVTPNINESVNAAPAIPSMQNTAAVPPPQVDTPPILSTASGLLDPELSSAIAAASASAAKAKPAKKHKNKIRNGTLPGMPSVNMALPEPGQ